MISWLHYIIGLVLLNAANININLSGKAVQGTLKNLKNQVKNEEQIQ